MFSGSSEWERSNQHHHCCRPKPSYSFSLIQLWNCFKLFFQATSVHQRVICSFADGWFGVPDFYVTEISTFSQHCSLDLKDALLLIGEIALKRCIRPRICNLSVCRHHWWRHISHTRDVEITTLCDDSRNGVKKGEASAFSYSSWFVQMADPDFLDAALPPLFLGLLRWI